MITTTMRGPGRNTPLAVELCPAVQYASGKSQARWLPTARFEPLVGFHVEAGRAPAWDAALAALRVPQCEIKHQRPGGAEVKPHWYLGEDVRFYPITAGPIATSVAGCVADAAATAQAGLGVRWGDGERSRLALRGYVQVQVGGTWQAPVLQLVQLAARSRMTDRLLAALLDHGRVCQAADAMIDRGKHPEVVTLHELALPLTVGAEEEWGRGETATVAPLAGAHPAEVDRAYVRAAWRPEALHAAACAAWPGVVAWATKYAAGVDADGNGHVE